MPRVIHVKKAQQRYETVPVIDPETGLQKKTPVMKNGKQKTTKRGTPVFMRVTEVDKTKPKPPLSCDFPGCTIDGGKILPGTPYKHITPKSGPFGGRQRNRHEQHPTWNVWDYSNSLGAQLARISHDFAVAIESVESPDEVTDALNDASEAVKEIAEQKNEGADNIESGFGHETSASEELREIAQSLEDWADEIAQADVPDIPECEECTDGQKECDDCEGTGEVDREVEGVGTESVECETCSGSGEVECENCDGSGEDLAEFRERVMDEVTIVDEVPV